MSKCIKKIKSINNVQFFIPFCFGWFVIGRLWNSFILQSTMLQDIKQCGCNNELPSLKKAVMGFDSVKIKKHSEFGNQTYRSVSYKSQSVFDDETNRWRLMTNKHQYEMINHEPRVSINGMWREELKEVDTKVKQFLKLEDLKLRLKPREWDLKDLYRQHDPFHGVSYFANYVDKSSGNHHSIETKRFYQPGIPRLLSIEQVTGDGVVNIICPISKVSERFNKFLDRYERNILGDTNSGPVRLLFVIFRPINKNEDKKSTDNTVAVLDEFKQRNPGARIEYIFEEGEFNRAVGIHSGVKHCNEDEIVLFLDVDLFIGSGFLSRVRRNTVRGKRIIFPIMFSQFDPDLMDEAASVNEALKLLSSNKMAINAETGFWIHYAYGVAAMYKSDYFKVGGFRLDIKGWGGEDVDLFKKAVSDPDLDVMWMVDKDLIHIYHSRGCDPKLAPDQYAMCIGAWSETMGSRREVASLYLDSHKDEI